MESKKAPRHITTPDTDGLASQSKANQYDANRQLFYGAVISMSWQLAIVVLIPVIGGFKLDQHFNTSPLWTIVGFLIAIGGMVIVVKRAVSAVPVVTPGPGPKTKGHKT